MNIDVKSIQGFTLRTYLTRIRINEALYHMKGAMNPDLWNNCTQSNCPAQVFWSYGWYSGRITKAYQPAPSDENILGILRDISIVHDDGNDLANLPHDNNVRITRELESYDNAIYLVKISHWLDIILGTFKKKTDQIVPKVCTSYWIRTNSNIGKWCSRIITEGYNTCPAWIPSRDHS